MRTKKLITLSFVLATCFIMGGCGKTTSEKNKEITLVAGFSTNDSDPRVVATELFKEEVEKATDGRIKVEIHTDGELGADSDLITGVVNGTVDMTASSAGNFGVYTPNVGISAMPFLFNSFEEAWEFVDSDIEKEAEAGLKDVNVKVLAHYDNGFRCVTTSEKAGPIDGVSDMNGLVIRTPENQVVMQTMAILGAEPKVLDFTKLYDALKNGEFDAQENPIPVIYNNKLYEVQDNLSITNHSYDVMPFVIRLDIWDSLSIDDQAILMEAAHKAETKNRELVKSQTEDYLSKLEEEGMHITYPDLEEFKQATESVIDSFKETYDPELLDKIK
ncbi:MAG: TRAP transporter substrate-binding protein [Lachnospiraceae bacterium]|nr:TRAP transporter substrate-binding protein [Lachnospiraceae bacterium]